ncbi:hypothetical protein P3X46_009232 [Hevea brasiliensis]|uniref:Kinesin motor domain-containing protein n=1 Tax=Hevea brasiliensis TaxID=3981 RepID=A0ABQ9MLP2_HEVBR|nr:hypothetical protein P3X46_009232 [Hevea brasiliensis]
MENCARAGLHDILTSRKAEEAAWRRLHAAAWLESLVGPLGISSHPSEKEFVSRLRNGLVLCNVINKVHPGAVPKIVENHTPLQSLNREWQPLPAYQYFENVRNFLVAIEELKLPAFEASDLERDTLEAGSAAKVVDCILALKSYQECKQMSGVNGFNKHIRSPMVMHPASTNNSRSLSSDSCRCLDMSAASEKQPADVDIQKLSDLIAKLLAEHMADAKENINDTILMSFHTGNTDTEKLVRRIMASCLEDKIQNNFPELKSMFKIFLKEKIGLQDNSTSVPLEDSSALGDSKCCRACLRKGNCKHRHLFQMQEKELVYLKALLTKTKTEFEDLQSKFQTDLRELGHQVQEMSTAALGYHRVLKENRNLYNMVQDLKGNIRVYCRIRPIIAGEKSNVIDFVGNDGSLMILDPLKPKKDGRKMFQFNRVFGPTATQDEVYNDTQPLIRSVMDGYNVCIFAYGQTGSGKTYTMLEIRSCSGDNGLSLPDAKMCSVKSTADVLNLMKFGEVNRVVSSTAINNRSSRSHSILTVHVHGKDISGSTLRSCLHLVDLAGSERVDKSEVTGDRLKEAQYINKSLSCLGDVITALAQRNSHVPYRNSKLTLLLQDSLGGHAKTLMFAHVSPEGDSLGETISTLKFAQRVSTVELGAACANKESSEIMQLKEQVENLRKSLASREPRPPCEKPKALTEQTPPRVRRLSIEKGSNTNSQTLNPIDRRRSKTPSAPTRSRRLSLEGPRDSKKYNFQTKVAPDGKPPSFEALTLQKPSRDPEAMSKMNGHSAVGSSMMEVYRLNAPRSPTSSSHQKRLVKMHSTTQIPLLQLPTTPEPQARNTVQIMMQNELALTTDFQTTNLIGSANGKGSQIRKSLRTIGKLINGSEKRNQQDSKEVLSPINGTSSNGKDLKTPLTANARAMMKQSLSRVQASGSDSSRRSSLGGKPPVDSDDSRRNARTPPPVHSSTRTTKKWL